MFVALGTQREMRVCHIVIRGLSSSTIFFPHYLNNGTIFRKMLLNMKYVFWFSLQSLSETFLILRRTEQDMIKKMFVCLHVKYPLFLSDFKKLEVVLQIFKKVLK